MPASRHFFCKALYEGFLQGEILLSMMEESSRLNLRHTAGQGRPFVIVHERGCYAHEGYEIASALSREAQVSLLEIEVLSEQTQDSLTDLLRDWLDVQGAKQSSLVGLGGAGLVIGRIAVQTPRLVRSIVLVDCTSRPHPTRLNRFIDYLESLLPMGLPVRAQDPAGTIRPFLHRIRCPALIISTSKAGDYVRRECREMSERMPSAWYLDGQGKVGCTLADLIANFQTVPARCPQKKVAGVL